MLSAIGKFDYSVVEGEYRLVVDVEKSFAAYYRALLPPSYLVQVPRWPPHITVVRMGRDVPKNLDVWGKYHGDEVVFEYDPTIQISKLYYWLNVWGDQLEGIREELGLEPRNQWTRPPDGMECFHITIANKKVTI